MMDPARKTWNKRQKELRTLLDTPASAGHAVEVFLLQHAEVHASRMSPLGAVSFEDEVLAGLEEAQLRTVPGRMEQSIGWILWHLARIEDVTMNVLVAGGEQVFEAGEWKGKLSTGIRHTGNLMPKETIVRFSQEVNLEALQLYRIEVGRRTEAIVPHLDPEAFTQGVSPSRLARLRDEGAVVEEAGDLLEYWGNRTIAGLLLMPPTRHCFIHLNEAARIKARLVST